MRERVLPEVALQFEWDEEKSAANLRKHRVGFDEARSVLNDPFSLTVCDPDHSMQEQRNIDVGLSARGRLLVVVYVERGSAIRVISCRNASRKERRRYEEGL